MSFSVRRYMFGSASDEDTEDISHQASSGESAAASHPCHQARKHFFSSSSRDAESEPVSGDSSTPSRLVKKRSLSLIPSASSSSDVRAELSDFVDSLVGPIGEPNEFAQKQMSLDRFIGALHSSQAERNRILVQFLRARHMNAGEAAKMIENAVHWRSSMNIESFLTSRDENLRHPNAVFPMHILSSADRCKQPVVYGLIRILDKKKVEKEPFQNASISFFETLYFLEQYTLDEMIVILDFRGWSLRRNTPYRAVKDGIATLQDYYPERLGRVFLVNYPTSIRAAYTAISPIIDSGAREKIVWVSDDPAGTLKKYVASKSIPTFLGGELEATFPESWPDIAGEWENAPDNVSSLPSLW